MGLNLCPFARAALPGTTVQVTRAETLEALRLEVRDALFALRDASEAEAAHKARLRAVTRATLAELPPAAIEAWTDGSVVDPQRSRQGGGGYVLRDGAGETHRNVCAAGAFCNSSGF